MPVVLLPARSHNLSVTGLLSSHWPRSSHSALQMVVMMRLCLVADGVINNEDHSSPRQPREERREQLSSHKSNQRREHGLCVQERVSRSVHPTVNILTFLPWLLRTEEQEIILRVHENENENKPDMFFCSYSDAGSLSLLALTLTVISIKCIKYSAWQ